MTDYEIIVLAVRHNIHGETTDPQAIAFAREIRRAALEGAAIQWDGCFYEGVGERIDIGAAIRALSQKDPQ
jgi:alpha/beta superfamily hydrolase